MKNRLVTHFTKMGNKLSTEKKLADEQELLQIQQPDYVTLCKDDVIEQITKDLQQCSFPLYNTSYNQNRQDIIDILSKHHSYEKNNQKNLLEAIRCKSTGEILVIVFCPDNNTMQFKNLNIIVDHYVLKDKEVPIISLFYDTNFGDLVNVILGVKKPIESIFVDQIVNSRFTVEKEQELTRIFNENGTKYASDFVLEFAPYQKNTIQLLKEFATKNMNTHFSFRDISTNDEVRIQVRCIKVHLEKIFKDNLYQNMKEFVVADFTRDEVAQFCTDMNLNASLSDDENGVRVKLYM